MNLYDIERDLVQTLDGDVVFYAGDIKTTSDKETIAQCNVNHMLRSGFSDIRYLVSYGANLESYIGRNVNTDLAKEIEASIRKAISYDSFITNKDYELTSVLAHDKIYFKLTLYPTSILNAEYKDINIVFSPIEGVSYV